MGCVLIAQLNTIGEKAWEFKTLVNYYKDVKDCNVIQPQKVSLPLTSSWLPTAWWTSRASTRATQSLPGGGPASSTTTSGSPLPPPSPASSSCSSWSRSTEVWPLAYRLNSLCLDLILQLLLAAPSGKLRLLCQPRGQLGKRFASPNHPHRHECHSGLIASSMFSCYKTNHPRRSPTPLTTWRTTVQSCWCCQATPHTGRHIKKQKEFFNIFFQQALTDGLCQHHHEEDLHPHRRARHHGRRTGETQSNPRTYFVAFSFIPSCRWTWPTWRTGCRGGWGTTTSRATTLAPRWLKGNQNGDLKA